jgi:hypothetical protein
MSPRESANRKRKSVGQTLPRRIQKAGSVSHSVADPDPKSQAFLTAGFGIREGQKSGSGIRINIQNHFFRKLRNSFWVNKYRYLNSLKRIRDLFDPGSGTEKIQIRDPA